MGKQADNKVNAAWERIVQGVWSDKTGEFAKRLRESPRVVFHEHGVEIPENVDLRIFENEPKRLHFVVPVKPLGVISDGDISEIYQACPGTQLDFAGGR